MTKSIIVMAENFSDVSAFSIEEKCNLLAKLVESVKDEIHNAASLLASNCHSLDAMTAYTIATNRQSAQEYDKTHPFVRTLVESLGGGCNLVTKQKSVEQIYFCASVYFTVLI